MAGGTLHASPTANLHPFDPEHLIVNGLGGAFLHPTHVFAPARFASVPDPHADELFEQGLSPRGRSPKGGSPKGGSPPRGRSPSRGMSRRGSFVGEQPADTLLAFMHFNARVDAFGDHCGLASLHHTVQS